VAVSNPDILILTVTVKNAMMFLSSPSCGGIPISLTKQSLIENIVVNNRLNGRVLRPREIHHADLLYDRLTLRRLLSFIWHCEMDCEKRDIKPPHSESATTPKGN